MATTHTRRIGGTASGGQTVRVSEYPSQTNISPAIHHLLQLEGDQSGYLLLEGDQADLETDAMRLEGDQATIIGGTITKRVTEPVA